MWESKHARLDLQQCTCWEHADTSLTSVLCFSKSPARVLCCTLRLKGIEVRGEQWQQSEVQKHHLCRQRKELRLFSPEMAEGKHDVFQIHKTFFQRGNTIPWLQCRDKKEQIQILARRGTLMTQRHLEHTAWRGHQRPEAEHVRPLLGFPCSMWTCLEED